MYITSTESVRKQNLCGEKKNLWATAHCAVTAQRYSTVLVLLRKLFCVDPIVQNRATQAFLCRSDCTPPSRRGGDEENHRSAARPAVPRRR